MRRVCTLLLAVCVSTSVAAGPLLDKLKERRAAAHADEIDEDAPASAPAIPPGVTVTRDVSYGSDAAQRFDVYQPKDAHGAPIIFMVHGGGWARGDKTNKQVVENKLARWSARGFVFVSVNYRMLPQADPVVQASDVAKALATVQGKAAQWGGDGSKVIVMGHSAGAHLVALLAATPQQVQPYLGTVVLDSAALNVEAIMAQRHLRLYDKAFGTDHAFWRAASPIVQMSKATAPLLAVCSSRRALSCQEAHAFVDKAKGLGTRAQVLEEDLSHREINETLGLASAYTDAVEAFLRTLDPALAERLK